MEKQRTALEDSMSHVTIDLDSNTEQRLRAKAILSGQTLEAYLEQLAGQDARGQNGSMASPLSDEEFDRLLDDLSTGPAMPVLPGDFSRADLYADHD
jgi:hypothetical protein